MYKLAVFWAKSHRKTRQKPLDSGHVCSPTQNLSTIPHNKNSWQFFCPAPSSGHTAKFTLHHSNWPRSSIIQKWSIKPSTRYRHFLKQMKLESQSRTRSYSWHSAMSRIRTFVTNLHKVPTIASQKQHHQCKHGQTSIRCTDSLQAYLAAKGQRPLSDCSHRSIPLQKRDQHQLR